MASVRYTLVPIFQSFHKFIHWHNLPIAKFTQVSLSQYSNWVALSWVFRGEHNLNIFVNVSRPLAARERKEWLWLCFLCHARALRCVTERGPELDQEQPGTASGRFSGDFDVKDYILSHYLFLHKFWQYSTTFSRNQRTHPLHHDGNLGWRFGKTSAN